MAAATRSTVSRTAHRSLCSSERASGWLSRDRTRSSSSPLKVLGSHRLAGRSASDKPASPALRARSRARHRSTQPSCRTRERSIPQGCSAGGCAESLGSPCCVCSSQIAHRSSCQSGEATARSDLCVLKLKKLQFTCFQMLGLAPDADPWI